MQFYNGPQTTWKQWPKDRDFPCYKAEKQWSDMATRLGRGYGYRPKERIRVRTKELERLLVSVEDAGMSPISLFLTMQD